MGTRSGRDVLQDKREARSAGDERFTRLRGNRPPAGREVNQPAVDARSLGARPERAQGPFLMRSVGASTYAGGEVNQPVVDARSLGASPEAAQGSKFVRKILKDFPEMRIRNSKKLLSKPPILQGDNGIQGNVSQVVDSFQQRPSGREDTSQAFQIRSSGRDNTRQAFQTRLPKDQTNFQDRTTTGKGRSILPAHSLAGRPRASRDGEISKTRSRKRGTEQNSNHDNHRDRKREEWTAEERQYLKEKAERESQKPLTFEPVEHSRENFAGMGPATASDEWSMSEMFRERLVLAKKYLDQGTLQWDSKEQKADVMAVVEKLKAVRGGNPNEVMETAKTISLMSGNGDQQAQALMQKLFAGEYEKFKRLEQNDVLGHVERHVHRNGSFYPGDEKSLLEKVRSIMPAERGRRTRMKA